MISEKAKARSVLVDAVEKEVIPLLTARGFRKIERPKEPIPMWDLHRPRKSGGYDVVSVIFDKKRRPLFYAIINVIEAQGVTQPWGEFVEAQHATAATPLKRVLLRQRKRGVMAKLLPGWFGYGWFGFQPGENNEANRAAASRACREFAACLEQADQWWVGGELGPNLVPQNIVVKPSDKSIAQPAQNRK